MLYDGPERSYQLKVHFHSWRASYEVLLDFLILPEGLLPLEYGSREKLR